MSHKRDYNDKRITVRVTLKEWALLQRMVKQGNFGTVSGMVRNLIYIHVREFVDYMDGRNKDAIRAEIDQMFRNCEEAGVENSWSPDINKRI